MSGTTKGLPGRGLVVICAVAIVAVGAGAALWVQRAGAGITVGPDVTVINLTDTSNHGAVGGIQGYSVGTTSCNIGDTPVWWCDNTQSYCDNTQHPVIAQNLYRLKDGQFEQLGLSWLKHGFLSLNTTNSACNPEHPSCTTPPHLGDQLGLGCTDTYQASLNGSRPLGMRSQVNASTGIFPYPYTTAPYSGEDEYIQVPTTDMDPTQNAGAVYWVEGHYVTADDAAAGNGLNNTSYRKVTVASGSLNLSFAAGTVRELPAIFGWHDEDPTVQLVPVDVPSSPVERFWVGRKVTDLGGGMWHYAYAITNLNSDRSGQSFTVTFPSTTNFANVGSHIVNHHSGEPYATTPWSDTEDSGAGTIEWFTDDFATDSNANALRWSTTFSFWFDADHGPSGLQHNLGLFTPGSPGSLDFSFPGETLFNDGFESGDTTAWSATFP
jgi:hypothetical protein